ncbi:conserved hypothetical protein [Vibrio chagasii]|nr:conserved hypothetical protein [Vibrio chagasii]
MKNTNMTKERYLEITANFKTFVNDKANKPYFDEEDGTKMLGKITFLHFVFYALFRGKNPEITTHDVESETYQHTIGLLKSMTRSSNHETYCRGLIRNAMGMTDDEITDTLKLLLK